MSVLPQPRGSPVIVPSAIPAQQNYVNNNTALWAPLVGATGATGPVGVTQIVAGTGIAIGPTGGIGVVTVSATPVASGFVRGMVLPYVGTTAPAGWAICDGTTAGVPDLRGRFVLGASAAYPFGASGGAVQQTLVVNNLPDHTHGAAILASTSGTQTAGQSFAAVGSSTGINNAGYTPSVPFDILNPHYNLTYIMYL